MKNTITPNLLTARTNFGAGLIVSTDGHLFTLRDNSFLTSVKKHAEIRSLQIQFESLKYHNIHIDEKNGDVKATLTNLMQKAARLRANSVLFTDNLTKTSQLVYDASMQVTQLLQNFQGAYLKSILLLKDQATIEIQKKSLEEFFLQLQVLCNLTLTEIDDLRVLYEELLQKLSSLDSALFDLNNEILSRQNQINEILRALIRLNFRYSEVLIKYRKYNLTLEQIRQTTEELESSFCADGASLASQQTIINTVTEKTNILENSIVLLLANIQKAQCVYEEFSFQIQLFWEKRKSSVNKRRILTEIFDGFFIIGGTNIQVVKDSSGVYTVHSAIACWPKVPEKVQVKLPRPQLVQMQLPSQACPATCGGGGGGGPDPEDPKVEVTTTTTEKPPDTTIPDVSQPDTPTTTVAVGTTTTLSPGNDVKTGVKCELFYPRRLGSFKSVQILPTSDPDIFLVDIKPVGSGAYGGSSNGSEDVGKYLCFFIARQTSNGIELYNEASKTFLATKPSLDYSLGIPQPIKVSYSPNLTDYVDFSTNGWRSIEISNPTRVLFPTTFLELGGTKTFSIFDPDIILYLGDPYFDYPVYEEDPKEYHPYWEAICYSRVLRLSYDVCPKIKSEAGLKNPKNTFVAKQNTLFDAIELDIISATGGDHYDVYLYFKKGDTYYFVSNSGSLVGPIVLTAATGYQSAQPVPIFLPKKSASSLVGQNIVFPIDESEWEQFNGYSICLALANTVLAEKYFLDSYIEAFCSNRTSCHAINLCDRYKNLRVSLPLHALAVRKNTKYEATINVLNVGTEKTKPGDFITFAVIWFDKSNRKKILTENGFVDYPYSTYARPKLIGNYVIPSVPTLKHTVVFDLPPDSSETSADLYLVIAIPGQVLDSLIRYFLCAPPTFNVTRPTTTTSSTTSSTVRPTTTTSTTTTTTLKPTTTTTTTTSSTPTPTTTTSTTTSTTSTTTTTQKPTTTTTSTTSSTSTPTTTTSTEPPPTPTPTPSPELDCEKYVPYDLRIHTFYKWFDPLTEELCIYYQFLAKDTDTDIDWFIVDFKEDENKKLTDGSWADPETGSLVKISSTKRHHAWKQDRLVQKTNKIGLSESLCWGVVRVPKQIKEQFTLPLLIWGNGEVSKLGASYYSSEEWVCNRGLDINNNAIDLSYDDCDHFNHHQFSMQIVQESSSAIAKNTVNIVFSDIARIPRPALLDTEMELDIFLYLVPKTFSFEGLRPDQSEANKVFCVENFVVRQLGDLDIDLKTVVVAPFVTKTKFAGQDSIRLVLDPLTWVGLKPVWLHSMEVIIGVGNKKIETQYASLSVKNTAQEEMFCANRITQFGAGIKWELCSPYKNTSVSPVAAVKAVPQIVCNTYGDIEINLLVENIETEPNTIFDIFAVMVKPNLTPEDGNPEEFGYLTADGTIVPILDWQGRWSFVEPMYSGKIKSVNKLPAFMNYTYESLAKSYHKITYYIGKKQTIPGLYSIIEATCSIRGACVVQLFDCFKYVTPTTLYFDYTGTKFISPTDSVNYYDSQKPHTGKENEFVWHKTINSDITGNLADIGLYIQNPKYFGKKMDVYLVYTQTFPYTDPISYFIRPDAQNKWVLTTDFANIVPVGSIVLQEHNILRYEIGADPLRTIGGDLFPGGEGCSLTLWLGDNSAPTNSYLEAQCFGRKTNLSTVYRQIVTHPEDRVVLLPLDPYRDTASNWKNQNKNLVRSEDNFFPNPKYLQVGTAIDHSKDLEAGVINGDESTFVYNDYLMMQNETEHHHQYWTENFPETSPYKSYSGWIHQQTSAIKQMYQPTVAAPYSVIAWLHMPFGSIINEGHKDSICYRATEVDENWQKPYYFDQDFVKVVDAIEKDTMLWFSLVLHRGHEELASVYFDNRVVATIKTNCFGFGENSVHFNSYLASGTGPVIDFFVIFAKDNFRIDAQYNRVTKQTTLTLPLHSFCGLVPAPTTTTKAPKPKCGTTYIFESGTSDIDFKIVGQNIERSHDLGIDGGAYFNFRPQYSVSDENAQVLTIRDANNTIIYQYEAKHNGLNFLLYSPTATLVLQFKNINSPDSLQYALSCGFLSVDCTTSFLVPKTGYYPNGILIEASGNYAQVLRFQVGSDNKINPITNMTDNSIVIGSATILGSAEYYFDNASVGELDFPVQNTGKNYTLNPKDFGFSSSYVSISFLQCNSKNLQAITSSCTTPVAVEFQGDWENMSGRGGTAEFWHYLSGSGTFDLFVSSNSAAFSIDCIARSINFSLDQTKMYDYANSPMAQFVLVKVRFLDWPSHLTYQFGCLNAPIRTTTTPSPTTTTPSPTTTTTTTTTTQKPTTTTQKPRSTAEDKLVLFDVINNVQILTISKLYDVTNVEYSPAELFAFGMDHFNDNMGMYENIEEWEQRLALAVFDNDGITVIDWVFMDSDYCPLRGSYDSITWMYAG